jgi:hypothetical protein
MATPTKAVDAHFRDNPVYDESALGIWVILWFTGWCYISHTAKDEGVKSEKVR